MRTKWQYKRENVLKKTKKKKKSENDIRRMLKKEMKRLRICACVCWEEMADKTKVDISYPQKCAFNEHVVI